MFITSPVADMILRAIVLTTIGLIWLVVLVRLNGLRSFSKMTSFDFAMTVAMGSLLASAGQATDWLDFGQILLVMMALFVLQHVASRMRKASGLIETIMQNEPVLLMRDGRFLDEALKKTRVSKSDLVAKLREANVLDLAAVQAVVLETTGDISVLHGDELKQDLLEGVARQKEQ